MPAYAFSRMRPFTRALGIALVGLSALACSDGDELPLNPGRGDALGTGERAVNVGGYKLHAAAYGTGTPAVILLSGLGETAGNWTQVRTDIARRTRVVTYDRGGVGASDLPRVERRSADVVAAELEALLERGDVRPPYVLVAHSVSGYYARVFAARNPGKVAGMVFLDAQHEAEADLIRQIPGYEEILRGIAAELPFPGTRGEFLASLESADQARAVALPRGIPVAAVTNLGGDDPDKAQAMYALHGTWVAQGTPGRHLVTERGHRVPVQDPATAVEAIRWTLDHAKK